MTNPFLQNAVERITRDPERKLGWEDRIIGTMRLVLDNNRSPERIAKGAAYLVRKHFGDNDQAVRKCLENLWPSPWTDEHEKILELISAYSKSP